MNIITVKQAVLDLRQGDLIIYPTEAMYGIGCDPYNPNAIDMLLQLKQREFKHGFILVASSFSQVKHLIGDVPKERMDAIMATWPGHITWLFPVRDNAPKGVLGEYKTVAIRISSHPVVRELSDLFGGPIISSSANVSGLSPALDVATCHKYFYPNISNVVAGDVGGNASSSAICDALTGRVLR